MTDKHDLALFGQKSAMIFSTSAKSEESLYICCIKKKAGDVWEKRDEGKKVKFSLMEQVAICGVLNKKRKLWSTFHTFNEVKTPISFSWDDHDADLLWINVEDYSRPINYPETEELRLFLDHILNEKIEFSTCGKMGDYESQKKESEPIKEEKPSQPQKKKELSKPNDKEDELISLKGKIKMNRDKAILIVLDDDEELWLPKSTITNNFKNDDSNIQTFQVQKWILDKRKGGKVD